MILNFVMAVFFGWLMVVSFILYKMRGHYMALVTRTRRKSIDEILDAVLKQSESVDVQQKDLKKQIDEVQLKLRNSFQKVGLIHFDAFGKSEGEQSFVLALLNEHNNGVVLNFIYIHDGIRVYTKTVKDGKGEKHELSAEEKEAIQKAL